MGKENTQTSAAHVRVIGNYTVIDMYKKGQLVSSVSIDRTARIKKSQLKN